jgi:tRNA(fMet)-specific endonuclease VapC
VICLDTTVLIDEFRAKGDPDAPVNRVLLAHSGESCIVPVIAAGEFLDGAAMISEERFQQALVWFRTRNIIPVSFETAAGYGKMASLLRKHGKLSGPSQNDLWIAATAKQHGARLLTRNIKDFAAVTGLEVIGY